MIGKAMACVSSHSIRHYMPESTANDLLFLLVNYSQLQDKMQILIVKVATKCLMDFLE